MKIFKIQTALLLLGLIVFASCEKEDKDQVDIKTIDFENLTLTDPWYWNGSDGSESFSAGEMVFSNNNYTTYWEGFSYSQKVEITGGTDNNHYNFQYSVYNPTNGANKYAIYYPPYGSDSFAGFSGGAEKLIKSISVCNSSYAGLSMKKGDDFAKKFGGPTGNDQDWLKMTIIGYDAAGDSVNAVHFYLADYRFANNSSDYILNTWTPVNLSTLGKVNKITFRFSSSDNGAFGINTPTIVCIDNIIYEEPILYN